MVVDNHIVGVAAATRAARKTGADAQDAAQPLLVLRELTYAQVLCMRQLPEHQQG